MAEVNTEQPATPAGPEAPAQEAPYGFMRDPRTGEQRPRKRAGRSAVVVSREPAAPAREGLSPSLEELKAGPVEDAREDDREPGAARRGRQRGRSKRRRATDAETPAPAFRAGPIASGMNRIYGRIGKVVKAMDRDIGVSIISITRKESPDDVTVGEAWEELARTNPRIRVFLLRLIEGGAWSQLIMIHLPIALAIVMKDGIRKRIPFGRLLDSLLDDDGDQAAEDTGASGIAGLLGGLTPGDMAQMGDLFQSVMTQAANGVPRGASGATGRVPVADGDRQAEGP